MKLNIQNFSVGFQNIHGLHGSLGCKVHELEKELKNDIEIWCEVWGCECKLEFDNYSFEIMEVVLQRVGNQEDSLFWPKMTWKKCLKLLKNLIILYG